MRKTIKGLAVAGALAIGGLGAATTASAQQPLPFGFAASNFAGTNIIAGQSVTFNASGFSANAVRYDWNFGDGNYLLAGPIVTHRYTLPGVYTVVLNTVDANGRDSFTTYTVRVFDSDYRFPDRFRGPFFVGGVPVFGPGTVFVGAGGFFTPTTGLADSGSSVQEIFGRPFDPPIDGGDANTGGSVTNSANDANSNGASGTGVIVLDSGDVGNSGGAGNGDSGGATDGDDDGDSGNGGSDDDGR